MRKLILPFMIFACMFAVPAQAWQVHQQYNIDSIKTFKGNNFADVLILEKAWTEKEPSLSHIERVQVRASTGDVVAFSPTRVTAIPFCFGLHSCWVFLWKTVYPFPAIYKLNPDPDNWIQHRNPPMKYSRVSPAGLGFDDKTNLLFGAFGVLLFLQHNAPFFLCCILFTIILTLQITHYRDLPEIKQKWIKRSLSIISGLGHIPLPVEPYMITAMLIFFTAGYGVTHVGVPLVISILVIIATFFLSSMRLGRAKAL